VKRLVVRVLGGGRVVGVSFLFGWWCFLVAMLITTCQGPARVGFLHSSGRDSNFLCCDVHRCGIGGWWVLENWVTLVCCLLLGQE